MKNIIIIGAGDLGKEIVWLIEDINKVKPTYVILGFLDDNVEKTGKDFFGYKVLGTTELLDKLSEKSPFCAVIAIQNGAVRRAIVEGHPDFEQWETIVHPTAVIAPECDLSKGNIIFPRVTASVDTKIGQFSLLYMNATVCNDCTIGDYASIMTGVVVSEHVVIENGAFLPAGMCVAPHTSVPAQHSACDNEGR